MKDTLVPSALVLYLFSATFKLSLSNIRCCHQVSSCGWGLLAVAYFTATRVMLCLHCLFKGK